MARTTRPDEWMPGFVISPNDTVVDVGCFDGDACVFAGGWGAEVIGIDIDPAGIARAIERMRQTRARSFRGIVSDCDPIPLHDETASAVICTETLEHVDSPERFLRELVRIGKPGARYLIAVPDPVSESLMRVVSPSWYFQKPIHQRVFERGRLKQMVLDAGLLVEKHTSRDFYSSLWWVFRMAVGMNSPCDPAPQEPLLADWQRTYQALQATAKGLELIDALEDVIPKSQVVLASKPVDRSRIARYRRLWSTRMKRWVKSGDVRLGAFRLTWDVRRAS